MITRRRLLLRGFAWMAGMLLSGYLSLRVAAHNGWVHVTWNSKRYDKGNEPFHASESRSINLLVIGDTGKATLERSRVIAAMRDHATQHAVDAAMLLGDNFYESGVVSKIDPRFQSDFENLFDADSFPIPFYVALGNHDCRGNAQAQVEYSSCSKRWVMPARYYKQSVTKPSVTVDLFVTDTNLLMAGGDVAAEQLAWLQAGLRQSRASWKLVVGHHPILTGGRHDTAEPVISTLRPILDHSDVDFYLSGHDHDLQLLDSGKGWRQIVSGAGSKLRSTSWIESTVFARACPGYVSLSLGPQFAHVSFYGPEERLITKRYQRTTRVTASKTYISRQHLLVSQGSEICRI